jgi:uncharacterized protein (TIGR02300 family)
MSTKAANRVDLKAQRGTKRMCQNPECGSRFYDLNRDLITCPVCSTVYAVEPSIPATPSAARAKPQRPPSKKPDYPVEAPKLDDVPEGDELVEEEEVTNEAEADDALMEVAEESPDVTGIIDMPIEETDEKA